MAQHRPTKPIGSYPAATMPAPPPAGAPGERDEEPAAAAPGREAPSAEIAALQFLDPAAVTVDVPLAFPFLHEGREVHALTLRRLAVGEVGAVMAQFGPDDPFDVWDFVSAMSGLPAPVVRGLMDDDGAEVLAKARPLLSRGTRLIFGMTETPEPPPAPTTGAASAPGAGSP